MYHSLIKEFDSGKCTKLVFTINAFWGGKSFYEAKIYTTRPREKVPSLEDLEVMSKEIAKKEWIVDKKQGYSHKVSLANYPNLKIQIKKIDEPKKIEENEID